MISSVAGSSTSNVRPEAALVNWPLIHICVRIGLPSFTNSLGSKEPEHDKLRTKVRSDTNSQDDSSIAY
jgi:hypothetical protein